MADVEPKISDPATSSDPFQHLHKMSTTAGLGSGDYVAISGTAILAILLGVASAMVLFDNWQLLAIPLAGVVCAIVAFRQIARSNGTQSGVAIAATGLVLSLGFGGFYGGKTIYSSIHTRSDRDQIISVIQQFGSLLGQKKFPAAYVLLDERLKTRVTPATFEGVVANVANSPYLGPLQNADWNGLIGFETDEVTGEALANGMVLLKYSPDERFFRRLGMSFRKIDGKWLIDQIPALFPEETGQPQPGAKPPKAPTFGPMGPAAPGK